MMCMTVRTQCHVSDKRRQQLACESALGTMGIITYQMHCCTCSFAAKQSRLGSRMRQRRDGNNPSKTIASLRHTGSGSVCVCVCVHECVFGGYCECRQLLITGKVYVMRKVSSHKQGILFMERKSGVS